MRIKSGILLAAGGIYIIATSLPVAADPVASNRANQAMSPKQAYAQHAIAASRPLFGWPALVKEARRYIGTNPTDRKKLWCATFMNMVLERTGYTGTNSDAARSFAQYGKRIPRPEVGAIAVLTRGKNGGHVGVVSGIDPHGNPVIISGNHNKRVGVAVYPRSRVIAYVMPSEPRSVPAQMAARAAASRPGSAEPALDSPIAELLAAIQAEDEAQARAPVRPAQAAALRQPVRDVAPAALPPRVVQQLPEQEGARRDMRASTPWGELFDAMENARAPRERRAEQITPGRVVR